MFFYLWKLVVGFFQLYVICAHMCYMQPSKGTLKMLLFIGWMVSLRPQDPVNIRPQKMSNHQIKVLKNYENHFKNCKSKNCEFHLPKTQLWVAFIIVGRHNWLCECNKSHMLKFMNISKCCQTKAIVFIKPKQFWRTQTSQTLHPLLFTLTNVCAHFDQYL